MPTCRGVLSALIRAASKLQSLYGNLRVPYGKTLHRIQRQANVADLLQQVPFQDDQPSLPCCRHARSDGRDFYAVLHADHEYPVGCRMLNKHYGVIGATYLAVINRLAYSRGQRVAIRRQRQPACRISSTRRSCYPSKR